MRIIITIIVIIIDGIWILYSLFYITTLRMANPNVEVPVAKKEELITELRIVWTPSSSCPFVVLLYKDII